MHKGEIKFQIGKNGLTSGIINSLELAFKNRKKIRIAVLKSGTRDRKRIKEIAEEIASRLNGNFRYKIIGFTIIMRKVGLGKRKLRKKQKM